MSLFTNEVQLEVQNGYWYDIFLEATKIAAVLDKNVLFKYNGHQIKLTAQSTPLCFIKQYPPLQRDEILPST